jgi:Protein of unknown function (DUF3822)
VILHNLFESTFNTNHCYLYNLSILYGADRFAYFIHDEDNQALGLRAYQLDPAAVDERERLHDELVKDSILRHNYRSVKVILADGAHTFIPAELFDRENQDVFIQSIAHPLIFDKTTHDYLPKFGMYSVYNASEEITALLTNFFPKSEFYHLHTGLFSGCKRIVEQSNKQLVFINVLNRKISIFAFDKQNLLYSNTFEYTTVKDFLYYTMLVFDQMKFSPERVPIYLSGEVLISSPVYNELYKYVRNVGVVQRPQMYRFGEAFSGLQGHFFFDLLSLKLCG